MQEVKRYYGNDLCTIVLLAFQKLCLINLLKRQVKIECLVEEKDLLDERKENDFN